MIKALPRWTTISLIALYLGLLSPAWAAERTSAPDPMKFFTGHTESRGVVENRNGEPHQRIRTVTSGRLVQGELRMEQELYFEGKPPEHRSWRVQRSNGHSFVATANDMVGTARGVMQDDTFSWKFVLALHPGNPLTRVRMTQHMYFQPDGRTMVNRSVIRKFGIVVATVTEQFRRR